MYLLIAVWLFWGALGLMLYTYVGLPTLAVASVTLFRAHRTTGGQPRI